MLMLAILSHVQELRWFVQNWFAHLTVLVRAYAIIAGRYQNVSAITPLIRLMVVGIVNRLEPMQAPVLNFSQKQKSLFAMSQNSQFARFKVHSSCGQPGQSGIHFCRANHLFLQFLP